MAAKKPISSRTQVMMMLAGAFVGDPQQWFMYEAQDQAFTPGMELADILKRPGIFTDSEAATEYARRVQRDPKVVAKWPKFAAGKPITVVLKAMPRGNLGATDKNTHTISLADNGGGNDYYTLLHEIAHLVAAYEKPGYATSPDGHGATFA